MYTKASQLSNTKPKKKKVNGRRDLVKELDALVRQILWLTEDKCITCGVTGEDAGRFSKENPLGLQVGHYEDRDIYALRWNLKNCHLQCTYCNGRHRNHKLYYTVALADKYGSGVFREFLENRSVWKLTNPTLNEIKETLEAMLEGLK